MKYTQSTREKKNVSCPGGGEISIYCVCRGLCDGPIPRLEKSYRLSPYFRACNINITNVNAEVNLLNTYVWSIKGFLFIV